MPGWLTNRMIYGLAFAVIAGLMGFAFYLQYVEGLEPCPLCMAQRIAFVTLGLVFLIAFLHGPEKVGTIIYTSLGGLVALAGLSLAIRQLWLQSLPEDQVPACGPGLEYMLEVFPMSEVITMMLKGTGECAEVQWTFLGVSIPGWTALAFVGFIAVLLFTFMRKQGNA
ncbi:disulfide bond formation protein B [Hahella sp. CCB-MM4]|uniref:disulfide bond formation protein B n=1 Tax=Hahella sp. (strain CCB-MM4) TaxID=1926491 RepID=UPI000BD33E99|nr:disulfide bond formation protein B [Hahella sp. CCB-MM4]OZG74295.1 disulfide bond formation protein B [Hahella sp. CCB-MM4]